MIFLESGLWELKMHPDIMATTSQKTNSTTNNKSQDRYQVEITRELNKEFLLYSYTIYTKSS